MVVLILMPTPYFLKANNRIYYSRGIQTKLITIGMVSNGAFHDIEVGARVHYDAEDRFQWEDGYRIQGGNMAMTSEGVRGAEGNRISSANAFAAYALYKYKLGGLTLTPGIRYENIDLQREDWGKTDANRLTDANVRENQIDVFIPGIGFNYSFAQNFRSSVGCIKDSLLQVMLLGRKLRKVLTMKSDLVLLTVN
jgi:Fe(3+) dicitrate transport protein